MPDVILGESVLGPSVDVLYLKESVFLGSYALSGSDVGSIIKSVEVYYDGTPNRVPLTVLVTSSRATGMNILWKGIINLSGGEAAAFYTVTASGGYENVPIADGNYCLGFYMPPGAEPFGHFFGDTSGWSGPENGYARTNADVHNTGEPDDPIQAGGTDANNRTAIRVTVGAAESPTGSVMLTMGMLGTGRI